MDTLHSPVEILVNSFAKIDNDALRLVLDAIPDPVFMKDENSRFVVLNQSMCDFMGHPYDELVGKTDHDFVPAEYADIFRQKDKIVLETGKINENEESIRSVDGQLRTLITRKARALMPDGARYLIGCITDITHIKQREETLQLMFDANPLPMWVFDKEGLEFLAVNQAAIQHYGYTRDEFLSLSVLDIRPSEDAALFREIAGTGRGTYDTGRTWRHVKSDGTVLDVVAYSKPMDYRGRAAAIAAIVDVTEQKRQERNLRHTTEFLDTVIENVPVMLTAKDAVSQRYVLMNRAGEEFLGVSRSEVIGKTDDEIFPRELASEFAERDQAALETGVVQIEEEEKISTPNNGVRDSMTRRFAVHSHNGNSRYVLQVSQDITEQRRSAEQIAYLASHDAVTGLPNRSALLRHLSSTIEQATSGREAFALMRISVSELKDIGDAYGPEMLDKLLCEVARRLQATSSRHFLARAEGEEFALISVEAPSSDIAAALADNLIAAFAEPFVLDGEQFTVGLSIGATFFPEDATDITVLLGHAQAALERAVCDGRNVLRFYEVDLDRKLRERRSLGRDIRSALDRKEISLHYQPQAVMTGEIIGYEALLRWTHPQRGSVSPAEFIPASEENGSINEIGEWVLRTACREAASWEVPLSIAVNLSPVQFRQGDLPSLVHMILLESGLAPNRLELEVTESVMMDDFSRVCSILRRLKTLGVRISIDDFGTGYSSLSYLHSLPLDKIKIDKSFVWMLQKSPQSRAITRAITGLGCDLSMQVIAEGVETIEQLNYLSELGCHAVQGYLIGEPRPIADYASQVRPGKEVPQRSLESGQRRAQT